MFVKKYDTVSEHWSTSIKEERHNNDPVRRNYILRPVDKIYKYVHNSQLWNTLRTELDIRVLIIRWNEEI
jgi:hypothetical protein